MALLRAQTSGGIFEDEEFSEGSQSESEADDDARRHISTPAQSSSARPVEMITSSGEYWQTTDQVIECIPLGSFHYRLLFVCGLALMADGMVTKLVFFGDVDLMV